MEQKKSNQERTRKHGGSSSFVDTREPSKAPRQDENGRELIGPNPEPDRKYHSIGEQGISNRLAEEEHAFPESDKPGTESDIPGSVETTPKQQGGNRGGV
jgi:hypothetical protein